MGEEVVGFELEERRRRRGGRRGAEEKSSFGKRDVVGVVGYAVGVEGEDLPR